MIALLDVPVSPSLVEVLRSFGYDGVHAAQIWLAKATDTALLDLARNQQRIVITERSICVVDKQRIRLTSLPVR